MTEPMNDGAEILGDSESEIYENTNSNIDHEHPLKI